MPVKTISSETMAIVGTCKNIYRRKNNNIESHHGLSTKPYLQSFNIKLINHFSLICHAWILFYSIMKHVKISSYPDEANINKFKYVECNSHVLVMPLLSLGCDKELELELGRRTTRRITTREEIEAFIRSVMEGGRKERTLKA
ncbi:hypothetical protein Dimus_000520 [Dionaea muscipula]